MKGSCSMGLDIVELVMTVEEHFGVTIPDAEAQRILTVGELYVYLLERTRRDGRIPCPTSQAFYRLRRILTEELGVDRALVRPATQLRTLFPAGLRENALVWLADTLALPDLPDLDPAPRGPTGRSLKVAITWAAAAARLLSLLLFALWLFDPARPPVAIVF